MFITLVYSLHASLSGGLEYVGGDCWRPGYVACGVVGGGEVHYDGLTTGGIGGSFGVGLVYGERIPFCVDEIVGLGQAVLVDILL